MKKESRKRPRTKHAHITATLVPFLLSLWSSPFPCQAAWTPSVEIQERSVEIHIHPFGDFKNDYTRKRKVSIRSVDWCGARGMMPLQQYHGPCLGHTTRMGVTIDSNNMSKSSQLLSSNIHSLNVEERRRLGKKIQAEARASQPLTPTKDLHILYHDNDIVVVHKPGGILCVPGPRRNPSLANLVHEFLHVDIHVDKTVVHRLDMDTSGIVVFALTPQSLSTLHDDFRHRRVQKTYHALVCGHVDSEELEIDLALERDPHHSPFMRVARTEERNPFSSNAISKFLHQAPKPSLTQVRILSYEFIERLPVTRLELRPHTGRTHQLRIHCAAIGHPIVGDDIYGYNGEGAPNGGLDSVEACSIDVQRRIQELGHPLCLHAQQLCIHHPRTRAPMIFQADASF